MRQLLVERSQVEQTTSSSFVDSSSDDGINNTTSDQIEVRILLKLKSSTFFKKGRRW